MSDAGQLPPRPLPPRRPADVVAAWVAWIGVPRLVASVLAIAVVAVGGYWLVRAPTPPVESTLPAAAATSLPAATLAVPEPLDALASHSTEPVLVLVHVAGAVARPGVYELTSGDRVTTAVDRAGGPTADADLDGLNLASPVTDGQRIYVPAVGEVDPAAVPSDLPRADADDVVSGPVDLNRATAVELDALPGIGPATAGAIVDDRARNGPFASVDELERVPGIGPAKLDALRELVTV